MELPTLNNIKSFKPSQIVEMGRDCIDAVVAEGLKINMRMYFDYRKDILQAEVCSVCLGGAVMYKMGYRNWANVIEEDHIHLAEFFDELRLQLPARAKFTLSKLLGDYVQDLDPDLFAMNQVYSNAIFNVNIYDLKQDLTMIANNLKKEGY